MKYVFVGKAGLYQVPKGAIVTLIKCFAKRKCIIEHNGAQYISMVNLLRKGKNGRLKTKT